MKKGSQLALKKRGKMSRVILFLLSLCAGIVVFVCLLQAEQAALSNYQTKQTLIATEDIMSKTVIQKDELDRYFKAVDVNAAYAVKGFSSIEEIESWMGQRTTLLALSDIRAKEQVYDEMFLCTEPLEPDRGVMVETCVKVDAYEYSIGGILRAGDLVDILIVGPDNESKVLLEDVLITKAFDINGMEISAGDKESVSLAFNILVEKETLQNLNALLEQGTVRLIKKFDNVGYE